MLLQESIVYCKFTLQVRIGLSNFSVVPLSFSLRISNRSQGQAISRRNTKGKSSGSFGNEILEPYPELKLFTGQNKTYLNNVEGNLIPF